MTDNFPTKTSLIDRVALKVSSNNRCALSAERVDGGVVIKNVTNANQAINIYNIALFKAGVLNFANTATLHNGECFFQFGLDTIPLNSTAELKLYSISSNNVVLKLKPNTEVFLKTLEYWLESKSRLEDYASNSDTLVISPGYPSSKNLYSFGFVHTSTNAYIKNGFNVDVFCHTLSYAAYQYEFDKSKVFCNNLVFLKGLISRSNYKRIIIHFIDEKFVDIIDSVVLYYGIKIYVYVHGAEVLYRNDKKMQTGYDGKYTPCFTQQKSHSMDCMYYKYSKDPNIKWLFVSNWMRSEAEKLMGVKFLNSEIINNGIDTSIFKYQEKLPEHRLNIFTLRRFDDINKYALDLVVNTILALKNKPFFNELKFHIYGDGTLFDKFAKQVQFSNVKFIRGFFTHKQVSELHKNYGIVFHPTRLDSMGCSSLEAVCSGLVLVSSNTTAVPEFTDSAYGTLSDDIENPFSYAAIIEDLYNNPKKFLKLSKKMSEESSARLSRDSVFKREMQIFKAEDEFIVSPQTKGNDGLKTLSICIPVYNIEKYLPRCLNSILSCGNRDLLEILIINDGSTDSTENIAAQFQEKYPSIVTLISKENGGHGSAVLLGIKNAKARYFRVVDGDDWVDSTALDRLISALRLLDVDLILTNFAHDYMNCSDIVENSTYKNLPHGQILQYDDVSFTTWGPILATATYMTSVLQDANVTLPEKCFYVDMEFNARAIANTKTLVHLDLSVYRYFVGRAAQSISATSFASRYKDHEKVIFNILSFVTDNNLLSANKRAYIVSKLLLPMINSHFITLFFYAKRYMEIISFYKDLISRNNSPSHKVRLPVVSKIFKSSIRNLFKLAYNSCRDITLIPHKCAKYTLYLMRSRDIHFFDRYVRTIEKTLLWPHGVARRIRGFFR